MGIETVRDEILQLTQKQANEKIVEAEKKAEIIDTEAKSAIESEYRKTESEIESLLSQLTMMMEASVKFEIKKIELSSKKEMLEKVFQNAVKRIESLDDKTHERLTKILLKDAKEQIDAAVIICNEKTKKWMPAGQALKTEEMLGGIIAETKDGRLRVDNRYETILEEVRRDALKKIAHKIF